MTTLHRLEDPAHRQAGGVLLTFPSGYRMQLAWEGDASLDVQATARELGARALAGLMDRGLSADADGTNWSSLVAGLGHVVREWAGLVGRA